MKTLILELVYTIMDEEIEKRAKRALIFAFLFVLIVFTINSVQFFGDGVSVEKNISFILIIASIFWASLILIASVGLRKRSRAWLIPFLAFLYISIIPLSFGGFIALYAHGDMDSFDKTADRRDGMICISWNLYMGLSAFIGIGLSIYFAIVLQGYYSALATMEVNTERNI